MSTIEQIATKDGMSTVVVADDHPALRMGIRLRLEQDGTTQVVGEAADGEHALRLLRELRPQLAVIDLRMPGLDGIELTSAARQAGLPTRIVLLSALTDPQLVERAFEAGAKGYVDKESPLDVLVQALREVGAGRQFIDPTLLAELVTATDPRLTERETEVLQLAADGHQNKVIAQRLQLGEETVKSHLSNVMRKLGVKSRTEAVASALRRSLIR